MGHAQLWSTALAGLAILLAGLPVRAAHCTAQSGPFTGALVELYTSGSCSGCPAAERWISRLGARDDVPGRLVPVALYLGYGDYTGARQEDLHARQRKLMPRQRMALVHAPQVLLQGLAFPDWSTRAFDEALARIHSRQAKARLRLEVVTVRSDAFDVNAAAELTDPAHEGKAALYLAAYWDKPQANQPQGNKPQARVVLEWKGPFSASGTASHRLPLLPGALPGDSGVVAFVQSRRSAEVLQALMLPACGDTFGYIRAKQAPAPSGG